MRRLPAIIASLLLSFCAAFWVVQAEYRHASIQIGSAAPAIPALALLLGLAALARLCRREPQDSRRVLVGVYLLLVMVAAVPSTPSLVYLFGQMTAAQSQIDSPGMEPVARMIPSWLGPEPGSVVRGFTDGLRSGKFPWRAWALPLASWALFLLTLLGTVAAALSLLRRSWMEHERLAYPMVQIPLRILSRDRLQARSGRGLFWVGFSITASLDGLNMLSAFVPAAPSFGTGYDIGLWASSRPWSALSPMWISYRPEIFGLAYLMPRDVLLTAWLSYVVLRLSTVARIASGSDVASTPYDYQEIGMGAFMCLFAILIFRATPDLRASFCRAVSRRRVADDGEPMPARLAWSLVVAGPIIMVAWLRAAGMPLWVAALHLFLLLAVAIVYARIRCETGAPSLYLFPFGQQQSLMTNLAGYAPLAGSGGSGLVALAAVSGLSRGVYPELGAYAAEGMSLAGQTGVSQRAAMTRYLAGGALGLIIGGWLYLAVCYAYGADNIGGGYQLGLMRRQYQGVAQQMRMPSSARPDLVLQTFLGAWLALGLNWARARALWFPLHPVGLAMASAYGYHLWFPFLLAWIAKGLILRLGGHSAYSRGVPFFLGIAMGRYLFTGIVWGLLGMTGHPAVQGYHVHFS